MCLSIPTSHLQNGMTPLFYAAVNSSLEAMRVLVEELKADPNLRAAVCVRGVCVCVCEGVKGECEGVKGECEGVKGECGEVKGGCVCEGVEGEGEGWM